VSFYEGLARLRLADETILVPAEFMPVIEKLGQAAEFDRRVLERAIAVARHLVSRGSEALISVNLSPRSLEAPGFLRSVARLFDSAPDIVGKVVIELPQRCWRTLDAETAGALAELRDKGVPFALDHATDLRIDPIALADRGVRFVKVPADLIAGADQGRGLDIEITDLASVLRRAGIKLVAERVERDEIVPDLIDLEVPLAQGFVFAPPRAVRPDVLQAPAEEQMADRPEAAQPETADPASSSTLPEPPVLEERRPFRAFLRRAS
jgi:cyclic-di-GMP phosphodiesterase TipF (flagellum assembly factor)